MGEPLLAQALRLLEEGRDREALVFLQPPQEGLPEAERLAREQAEREAADRVAAAAWRDGRATVDRLLR